MSKGERVYKLSKGRENAHLTKGRECMVNGGELKEEIAWEINKMLGQREKDEKEA